MHRESTEKQNKLNELSNLSSTNAKEFWMKLKELQNGHRQKSQETDNISPGTWYDYLSTLNKRNPQCNEDPLADRHSNVSKHKEFTSLDFTIKQPNIFKAI